MNPMDIQEEEMLRKERESQKDLEDTIGLVNFISKRDLVNRGRNVTPSGKQWKEVQSIAATLRIGRKSKKSAVDNTDLEMPSSSISEFDLLSKDRLHVHNGPLNKRDPDGILWKTSRKHLFVFNDLILITTNKDNRGNEYELHEVLWMKDIKLNDLKYDKGEDPTAFEIQTLQRNNGRGGIKKHGSYIFCADNELAKETWVNEIKYTLYGYYLGTPASKNIGWFHEVVVGSFQSAAYTGNLRMVRLHLKELGNINSPDIPDESGMCPIHWAVWKGHEACVRILLDKGADVDCLNGGLNSPLLLAASRGHDTVARLLIEKGADPSQRNLRDRDAVFMAVVYGHSSKGLPWLLQLLTSKGLNLNQVDSIGATPLHVCAEKNLARPVRMLVDSGANVNVIHQVNKLTPLQMACNQSHPDVETIRSFLDKGSNPNWRDSKGQTAFTLVMAAHKKGLDRDKIDKMSEGGVDGIRSSIDTTNSSNDMQESVKWRAMEETIEQVGDWAVRALPTLLEIVKKGGRYDAKDLDILRPSFRSAVELAHAEWGQKRQMPNFVEFVLAREQAGEDFRVHKSKWTNKSKNCGSCSDLFGVTNRKHHCRSCGALVCDLCSSKRLQLTVIDEICNEKNSGDPVETQERICDGCFNRLMQESSQPCPDHPRVRELKLCAVELMESIGDLIEALDDPHGDPHGINAALRSARLGGIHLGNDMSSSGSSAMNQGGGYIKSPISSSSMSATTPERRKSSTGTTAAGTPNSAARGDRAGAGGTGLESRMTVAIQGEELIEAIKRREEKLSKSENLTAKFLEASDGYHRIAKKLIEQKIASNRLWGLNI